MSGDRGMTQTQTIEACSRFRQQFDRLLIEKRGNGRGLVNPLSTAAAKCAKWRRKSVPVGLREKGRKALVFGGDLGFGLNVSFAGCFRGEVRRVVGSALDFLAGGEPEAVAVHFQDVDVVTAGALLNATEPRKGFLDGSFLELLRRGPPRLRYVESPSGRYFKPRRE